MKIYVALLIPLLVLSFLVSGVSAAQNQNVGVHPVLKTKMVMVNSKFAIALGSNPTTGYSWTAKFDPDYIQLVNSTYLPYPTRHGIVGSGGIEIFIFKAIKPGKTVITMQYQRPWEETVPPLKEEMYGLFILKNPFLCNACNV